MLAFQGTTQGRHLSQAAVVNATLLHPQGPGPLPPGSPPPIHLPSHGPDNLHKHPEISHTDAKILAPGSLMLTRNTETEFGGKKEE